MNQGGQMRSFTYDSLRRLRSATNPESGTVTYPAYDDNGNLVRRTDARGVTTTYGYDPLNRLLSRSYSDSTPAVSYVYDTVWKGRLSAVSNAVSSTAFTQYDALGRATASTQTTAGVSFPFSYSFNRAGALKTLGYPSGRVVSYSFDAAGRVSGVTGQKGATSTTYASLVNYAPQGALSRLTLGNGLVESWQYSPQRQQPTSISLGSVFGVNLYRTATIEEGKTLAEQDPAVQAGRLAVEIHPWMVQKGTLPDP